MYIPMDWLKDKKNEKEIRSLLSETSCLQFEGDEEKIESRLKELGEHKILEELKKGTFAV
jgi:hypothetical protein